MLIIDADMRKGYVQCYINLDWERGLLEILSGKLETKEVIKTSGIETLMLLPWLRMNMIKSPGTVNVLARTILMVGRLGLNTAKKFI